jgi:2-hydroxyglutarate dehydrogenase
MQGAAVTPPAGCDIVVIGGGIVGLAVARELLGRHPGASVCVLEREPKLASHQTGHTSGVIHAGIYYAPGSLKARLCVEGARDLYAYCDERGIEARRDGKLIVAAAEGELRRLDELERRGRANEVPGLRRVGPGGIREIEPHARGVAALHSPATGVVDFGAVARGYAQDVRASGGAIVTGCEVRTLAPSGSRIEVGWRMGGGAGSIDAGYVLACAGAWSDRLAVAAGAPPEPRIVPFRGAYRRLRPERRELVRASIYPVPDPDLPFLGAHLTRTIAGEVLLGPSALMVAARDGYRLARVRPRDLGATLAWPGTWRLMRRFWRTAAVEVGHAASRRAYAREARRFVPELSARDLLPGPSGIRAQALDRDGRLVDDFVVHRTERALHVRNAPSPAATSSLALARLIADEAGADLS